MNIIAFLPNLPKVSGLCWERIEASDAFLFRQKASLFPNLRIEGNDSNPFGKVWQIRIKVEEGKNRDRTRSYPLNLKLRLSPTSEPPTHEIEWVFDAGKFCPLPVCGLGSAAFQADSAGWLIFAVRPLPIGEPQTHPKVDRIALIEALSKVKAPLRPSVDRLEQQPTAKKVAVSSGSAGAEVTNEGRSNEERREESIVLIEGIVATLKQQHSDWDSLKVRSKIALIKAEAKKLRQVAVSTQTLYQNEIKPLWQ